MAIYNPKDKSRTSGGKLFDLVQRHTRPPEDQGGWIAFTRDMLESPAFRTLSVNAYKALHRLLIEHISHNRMMNGQLITTHDQFISYGVTSDLVADAIEELCYKRLVRARKGKAGDGTPHATIYTLTFDGTADGAPATNDWRSFTMAEARLWSEGVRKQRAEARAKSAAKKKTSLGNRLVRPLGNHLVRKRSEG